MSKGVTLFLLSAILFACAVAQTITVDTIATATNPVGVWSSFKWITLSVPPQKPTTFTIYADSDVQFVPAQFVFTPQLSSASFRWRSNTEGIHNVAFVISYSEIPSNVTYADLPNVTFTTVQRSVTYDSFANIYSNIPSEPKKITLSTPSTSALTFTATTDAGSSVTFTPNPVIIPAGAVVGTFSYMYTTQISKYVNVVWAITGAEALLYKNLTSSILLQSLQRNVVISTLSYAPLVRGVSTAYAYSANLANTTHTIVPQAADTVFNPPQFTFSPGVQYVAFTYNTTTPESGGKGFNYFASAESVEDFTTVTYTQTAVVNLRSIVAKTPSVFILGKPTTMSLTIGAPVVSSVTVLLAAANIAFSPSSVTFSGTTTSFVIQITPFATGPDSISYVVSGDDAVYYSAITATPLTVAVTSTFIGPSSWYVPTLFVGVESDKLPVRVNVAPATNVTLTPVAADCVFTPASITFTAQNMQQYFTITPLPTNSPTTDSVTATTINYIVSGGDATFFAAPSARSISVGWRSFQAVWSPHVLSSGATKILYLNKQYLVWVTANLVGASDSVTVTPVCPYATFSPSVLSFSSSTLQVQVTVTVTGAVGSANIDWLIGGPTGGYYTPLTATAVYTTIRDLSIYAAVLSPDNRVPGTLVIYPASSALSSNHIYALALRSTVVPDSELTITPRSAHVTFSPASINLNRDTLTTSWDNDVTLVGSSNDFILPTIYVMANFTLTPASSGVHDVWFDLSGADAPYYDIPNHQLLSFAVEDRPATEIPPPALIKSASTQVTSSLVATAVVVAALMLLA